MRSGGVMLGRRWQRYPWLVAVAVAVCLTAAAFTPVYWLMWQYQTDFGTVLRALGTTPGPRIRPVRLPDGRTCYFVENRWRDDLVCEGAVP